MNQFTRDALKDYPKLLKKFEMSEAKFLVDTGGNYDVVEIELNIPQDKLRKFIACLAKYDMCFDEWACFTLTNAIIQLEMADDSIFDEDWEDDCDDENDN